MDNAKLTKKEKKIISAMQNGWLIRRWEDFTYSVNGEKVQFRTVKSLLDKGKIKLVSGGDFILAT